MSCKMLQDIPVSRDLENYKKHFQVYNTDVAGQQVALLQLDLDVKQFKLAGAGKPWLLSSWI